MATSKEEIRSWLEEGKKKGATHVVVVTDTYDWDDYPVYVKPGENAREIAQKFDGVNMQKLMECYSLSLDIEKQLEEGNASHYD